METYKTSGTCSKEIIFDVVDHKIETLKSIKGCHATPTGVAKLALGRDIDEVISLLDGIVCRNGTSCPDQLARALKAYKAAHNV